MKILTLITTLLFSCSLLANDLDIGLSPSKTIQPGEVAIQVLPVKAVTNTRYEVLIESNQGWRVEGPKEIALKQGEVNYLTFNTFTPTNAKAGLIHEMKVSFINANTQGKIIKYLTFKVGENRSLDYFVPDREFQTSNPNHTMSLKLRNSGNTAKSYDIEIENLTPDASVFVKNKKIEIQPEETKLVEIKIRFPSKSSSFAAFIVKAKIGSDVILSKRFQVKLLARRGQDNGDGNRLDHSLLVSNDFISAGDKNTNLSSVLLSSDGDLSDFVSLSSYIQASLLSDSGEAFSGNFDFTGDNWRATLGDNVRLKDSAQGVNSTLRGAGFNYDILKNLDIGTIVGINEENEINYSASAGYSPLPGQRLFVLINKNEETNEVTKAAGFRGEYIPNDQLSFAPVFTISDTPNNGVIQDFRSALKYLIRDNLPIIVNTGLKRSDHFDTTYVNSTLTLSQGEKVYQVSAGFEKDQDKVLNNEDKRQDYKVSMQMPISSRHEMTVSYRYFESSTIKEHRPELIITYKEGNLRGSLRSGLLNRESNGDSNDLNWAPYLDLNLKYTKNRLSLRSRYYFESFNDNYYRSKFEIRGDYETTQEYLNGNLFLTLGSEEEKQRDYYDQMLRGTKYVEFGFSSNSRSSLSYELYTRFEANSDRDDNELLVGARVKYNFGNDTPRSVENLFGGRRDGTIIGLVCEDLNDNKKCDIDEPRVYGIDIATLFKSTTTNGKGEFNLQRVKVGNDVVKIKRSDLLSKGYDAKRFEYGVVVKKNQTTEVHLPVFKISLVKAFSFIDMNGDGSYSYEIDTVNNQVSYALINEKGERRVLNQQNNETIFTSIAPGKYKLEIILNNDVLNLISADSVALEFPRDNGKSINFIFEAVDDDILTDEELILTELDSPIVTGPDFEASLTIDASESEFSKVSKVEVLIDGQSIPVKIQMEFDGYYTLNFKIPQGSIANTSVAIQLKITAQNASKKIKISRTLEVYPQL